MTWRKAKRAHVVAALVVGAALGGMVETSNAAKPTQKEALAACRAQYGKKVVNAIVQKDGKVRCEWMVRREMTREEAFESCRKKYSATTVLLRKTKDGCLCRYYGRY
ncbi:hypothetical protein G5V57_24535 [Nordella sp. HKS 07]|uniref:hypothetical protein n=1 Tax=Nordella sp. HKS 07 TaxID=2712222 RepID=UPI0013E11049|nr:hypothetical protein [Nordella sp. HKS 07]QIG50619.1 hypothetical protein G5V57_24535 [Nordella sp. HKS 07]